MGTILAALGKDEEALDAFQHAREFGDKAVSAIYLLDRVTHRRLRDLNYPLERRFHLENQPDCTRYRNSA